MEETGTEVRKPKNNYIMERDIFNILTMILAGLCVYAGVIYFAVLHYKNFIIYLNLFGCFVICIHVHVLNKKMRNLRLITIAMVMYIELVLMPVFMNMSVES